MKKSILAVAVLLGTSVAFAQDLKNEMGESYLPEAEDWAISIDATPFLSYFGNLIGGNDGNVAPSWNYLTTNQTITGKYFVDANTAYRAALRIGFGSVKGENEVRDRSNTAAVVFPSSPSPMVINDYKSGSTNIGLAVGMEKRRGQGRLQGFYGAELGINISSSKNTFNYGNALNQSTTGGNVDVDADDDMLGGINVGADAFGNNSRITEAKSGMSFGVGLRAFIGAEYFVMPRLAIGGEFGWGLAFTANGTSSTTMQSEGINAAGAEEMLESTVEVNNGSSFGIDTDGNNSVFGPAANIKMTFYF